MNLFRVEAVEIANEVESNMLSMLDHLEHQGTRIGAECKIFIPL